MTTLHHLTKSRSERIAWALEEIEAPYQVLVHHREATGAAPASLKEAPVLERDDKVYTESGAILHLLLTDTTVPHIEASPSFSSVFWSHRSEALLLHLQMAYTSSAVAKGMAAMKTLYLMLFFQLGVSKFDGVMQDIVQKNVAPLLDEVEDWLTEHPNFSGTAKLGTGDFMMFYPLHSLVAGGRKGAYAVGPKTTEWVHRILERDAMKRAMHKIGEPTTPPEPVMP